MTVLVSWLSLLSRSLYAYPASHVTNSPSAEATCIPRNGNFCDLAVLLISLPQVILVGLENHVADKKAVAGLV